MASPPRDVVDNFEAWAALAAALRVRSDSERRSMLASRGLEALWNTIHEAWSKRLNEDIAAGDFTRPNRYLEVCAREAQAAQLPPANTLPPQGLASVAPTPFESLPEQVRGGPGAGFAALAAMPSASRRAMRVREEEGGRAPVSSATAVFPDDDAPPPTLPTFESFGDGDGVESRPPSSSDRALDDFRASLMPSASVARPARNQEHTQLAIDPEALRAGRAPRRS